MKKILASILALCMVLSTMGTFVFAGESEADVWDGTADTSWYNETDTEFTITTAEQLAGLAELVSNDVTFAGVTFTLAKDLDLYCEDTTEAADGDPLTFRPIGDHSKNGTFEGTFDGNGKTISNLYQNGWDLGYEWGAYGSYGLFGNVNNATIKNLTITGSESYIEGGDVSCITGSATGTCVFENITIKDSVAATYNNGCGGIIGWSGAGNYTFKNITIAEDVTLAGLWGSFDSSIGGVVGQAEPGATYNFENVDIACRLDIYNDCTASYDYYNYRMCGMIIGRLEETTTIDGKNYPDMTQYNISCTDVNVTIGEWANYHYCEPTPGHNGGRGMRVEPGYAYDGLPADYDHSNCTTNHMACIPFDTLFGGAQLGVPGADEKALEILSGTKDIVSGLEVEDKAHKALYAVDVYKSSDVTRAATLIYVDSYATLQEAIDSISSNAGEYELRVIKDITEDVTVTQYPDQKITITGDETDKPVINGTISINGQSARYATAAITIENIVFDASDISGDTVIIAGWDNYTRYISNLTVSNCDFVDETASKDVVAIKDSTGGSVNFKIVDCTATGLHSLTQFNNVEIMKDGQIVREGYGAVIDNCTVTDCHNGIHLGYSSAKVTNTTVSTDGYGIRSGNKSGALNYAVDVSLENNTINAVEQAVYLREGSDTVKLSVTSGSYFAGEGYEAVENKTGKSSVAISGGLYSSNVDAYLVDGYALTRTANGYMVVEDTTTNTGDKGKDQADSISIEYRDVTVDGTEGEKTYEVIVKANDGDKINELASVDLTFVYTTDPVNGGAIDFTVAPAKDFTMSRHENTNRYMFNYNGVNAYEGIGSAIPVGTITVKGYGAYTIATKEFTGTETDTNIVNATTLFDNLVDSYTVAGAADNDTTTGALIINTDSNVNDDMYGSVDSEIEVPTRELTVKVTFPNTVKDNGVDYQNMKVEITGNIDGVNQTVTYDLGDENNTGNASYEVKENRLVLHEAYTVTVSGDGYRTARYTVTMTDDKTLNFWNNVMDNAMEVEEDKASSAAFKNFLAGDIVADNNINIYDLSAVVSYFTQDAKEDAKYIKYDLNRDGIIDSKDVAYVLVSWGE